MLPDEVPHNLGSIVKRLAKDAIADGKPVEICFGTVESEKPLKIRVSQKTLLEEDDLFLTNAVQEHSVDITVSHQTEEAALSEGAMTDYKKHRHAYQGRKKITLHYGLKRGEAVLLLREQGGQNYLVVDRMTELPAEGEWL